MPPATCGERGFAARTGATRRRRRSAHPEQRREGEAVAAGRTQLAAELGEQEPATGALTSNSGLLRSA